jgi:hypothetical protein
MGAVLSVCSEKRKDDNPNHSTINDRRDESSPNENPKKDLFSFNIL